MSRGQRRRLLRVFRFTSYLVAVVVVGGKVERGEQTAVGAALRRVRVLENRGVGKRKTRKSGWNGREETQDLHCINRTSAKALWKRVDVSGKGGLEQKGQGSA
jgi:hypothetical protein